MISQYDKLKQELEAKKCLRCNGHGECDDAEPGDISFRTSVCQSCNGTGMQPSNASEKQP